MISSLREKNHIVLLSIKPFNVLLFYVFMFYNKWHQEQHPGVQTEIKN